MISSEWSKAINLHIMEPKGSSPSP